MNLREGINRQPRVVLVAWCLSVVALLGVVDYLTAREVSFSIFYVLPIAAAAWYSGRRAGIAVSIVSAAAWLLADRLSAYSFSLVPYWNALVRLLFFLIVTFALASLRRARDRQMELIHFIVHDLRSPLTNVMAGLDFLETNQELANDPDQKELWEMARVSTHRIMGLVDSLLDVSRLEAGKMPLRLDDVDVRELVDLGVGQVSLWARLGDVSIATHIDPAAPKVRADCAVAVRVLVNLLSNAIKFSPPGSTITVTTKPRRGGKLVISVTDEGPGVPKEWATRVFDKFGQVGARNAGAAVGTGLGLTFCRLAVEAHGGQIWIEEGRERGTKIALTLPLHRQKGGA